MKLAKKMALMFGAILLAVAILATGGYLSLSYMMGRLEKFAEWSTIDMIMNERVIQTSLGIKYQISEYESHPSEDAYKAYQTAYEDAIRGVGEFRLLLTDAPELVSVTEDAKKVLESLDAQMQDYKDAADNMQEALTALRRGTEPSGLLAFEELRDIVGFPAYDATGARYADAAPG